jgi:RNA polymerase sigma-70 factor (ECF subfamily)
MRESAGVTNVAEFIPTRESLLSRLKDWGDQESWRQFFETYWRLIYNTAIKAGLSDAEAQDVVQETVISVLKSMMDFEYRKRHGSFKSWLLQLTRWRIADHLRRRKPEVSLNARRVDQNTDSSTATEITNGLACSDDPQVGASWEHDWEANLMDVAIARVKKKVDAKQYQLFDLCVFKEWPVSRIARSMNVSPARVYLAKHRITRLVRQEVRELHTEPVQPLLPKEHRIAK